MKKNKQLKADLKPKISNNILVIAAWSLVAILLYLARVIYTDKLRFFFLNWNLLLAWIPLIFSSILFEFEKVRKNKLVTFVCLAIWLFFLPNAFYILTDFVHLRITPQIGLWYDIALIAAYAGAGLVLGLHSLSQIDLLFLAKLKSSIRWGIIGGILFLNSFGIYLGRFLRWNSWDIFSNFFDVAEHVGLRIIDPFSYPRTYAFTFLYGSILFLIYWSMTKVVKR